MKRNTSVHETNDAERAALEQRIETLQVQNAALAKNVKTLEDRMIRCPLTGLYNKEYFEEYMQGAIDVSLTTFTEGALLYIFVDTMSDIKIHFGSAAADEMITKIGAFLPTLAPEEAVFFRLSGDLFAIYIADLPNGMADTIAERIRSNIEEADIFAERTTVSIGVAYISELREQAGADRKVLVERFMNQAILRLGIARRMGANAVCTSSEVAALAPDRNRVLVADPDAFRRSLVTQLLSSRGFVVNEATSGAAALEIARRIEPALIIAEFALPGLDAISLRDRLREKTELARVPFIMIVDRKSAEEAARAYELGISVILQRPILISEFLGLAENLVKEGSRDAG